MKTQVMFAKMRESYSPGFFPFILQPSELLPIDVSKSILSKETEFNLMRRDMFGIVSFAVPRALCTCVFKVVQARFSIGQIVIKKGGTTFPFRIYDIEWDRVDFWYKDGWGVSQNYASGAMEADLRLATPEEIEENRTEIAYYDQLMKRKNEFVQTLVLDSRVNENQQLDGYLEGKTID